MDYSQDPDGSGRGTSLGKARSARAPRRLLRPSNSVLGLCRTGDVISAWDLTGSLLQSLLSKSRQLELLPAQKPRSLVGPSVRSQKADDPVWAEPHGPTSENVPARLSRRAFVPDWKRRLVPDCFHTAMANARRGFNGRLGSSSPPRIVSVGRAWAPLPATELNLQSRRPLSSLHTSRFHLEHTVYSTPE